MVLSKLVVQQVSFKKRLGFPVLRFSFGYLKLPEMKSLNGLPNSTANLGVIALVIYACRSQPEAVAML
jgi:hypothetical protein